MSKQIEERVVSMQFDNSRFERNVSQSMSTLDKLKQKLNLSGSSSQSCTHPAIYHDALFFVFLS